LSTHVKSQMHQDAVVYNTTLLTNHKCYSLCPAENVKKISNNSMSSGRNLWYCSGAISRSVRKKFHHTTH